MEIRLERRWKKKTYSIGNLYVEGEWFCNTLEDKDRGLRQDMSEAQIAKIKVKSKTAIPTGRYRVTLRVQSPKYKNVQFYRAFCGGYMPRLLSVPGYQGVLIHAGNDENDTAGCILVGLNKEKGKVLDSRKTFVALYNVLERAQRKGEEIWLTIE